MKNMKLIAGIIILSGLATGLIFCNPSGKGTPVASKNTNAVTGADGNMLTFVFYNTENLFDIFDDPRTNDQEFLPNAKKQWNQKKYQKKIDDLARVIDELGKDELPEIIGLCEVENRKVVEDFVAAGALKNGNYQVVHFEDRDTRGIDLAVAFRPDELNLISKRLIPIRRSSGKLAPRGILYVIVKAVNGGELFHVFVNHWPARENDNPETESSRISMAGALRRITDSLLTASQQNNVVIMGDLNDEPADKSLRDVLGAVEPGKKSPSGLVNLMHPAYEKGEGTHKYNNQWRMLDNLIISNSLLDRNGFRCTSEKGFVFHLEWMEFRNRNGAISPDRTYASDKYTGGVSDHFPVFFRLEK